jgi:hypothetical protein
MKLAKFSMTTFTVLTVLPLNYFMVPAQTDGLPREFKSRAAFFLQKALGTDVYP